MLSWQVSSGTCSCKVKNFQGFAHNRHPCRAHFGIVFDPLLPEGALTLLTILIFSRKVCPFCPTLNPRYILKIAKTVKKITLSGKTLSNGLSKYVKTRALSSLPFSGKDLVFFIFCVSLPLRQVFQGYPYSQLQNLVERVFLSLFYAKTTSSIICLIQNPCPDEQESVTQTVNLNLTVSSTVLYCFIFLLDKVIITHFQSKNEPQEES